MKNLKKSFKQVDVKTIVTTSFCVPNKSQKEANPRRVKFHEQNIELTCLHEMQELKFHRHNEDSPYKIIVGNHRFHALKKLYDNGTLDGTEKVNVILYDGKATSEDLLYIAISSNLQAATESNSKLLTFEPTKIQKHVVSPIHGAMVRGCAGILNKNTFIKRKSFYDRVLRISSFFFYEGDFRTITGSDIIEQRKGKLGDVLTIIKSDYSPSSGYTSHGVAEEIEKAAKDVSELFNLCHSIEFFKKLTKGSNSRFEDIIWAAAIRGQLSSDKNRKKIKAKLSNINYTVKIQEEMEAHAHAPRLHEANILEILFS